MAEAEMSVILVAAGDGTNLTRILPHLSRLEDSHRLELIVVADPSSGFEIPEDVAGAFNSARVLPGDLSLSARARVAGIRAARAPIVTIVEDHAFPANPDWVRRHLKAHEASHAGVGPLMLNANPRSVTGWANLLVEYAPWLDIRERQTMASIPGHNSSYKRAALAPFDNDLEDLFESEWVLHQAMRENGHTLLVDPAIEIAHLNPTGLKKAVRLQHLAGRVFAGNRARGWSLGRRLFWAAAFPAISALRAVRTLRFVLTNPKMRREVPFAALPVSVLILFSSGLGEGLGYAFGNKGFREALTRYEFTRYDDLDPNEPIPYG